MYPVGKQLLIHKTLTDKQFSTSQVHEFFWLINQDKINFEPFLTNQLWTLLHTISI